MNRAGHGPDIEAVASVFRTGPDCKEKGNRSSLVNPEKDRGATDGRMIRRLCEDCEASRVTVPGWRLVGRSSESWGRRRPGVPPGSVL